MRVVVTGATGLIGTHTVNALLARGDSVVALPRNAAVARTRLDPRVTVHEWSYPLARLPPVEALSGADAVINLLGEPVAQRWSPSARAAITDSRMFGTRHLVSALRAVPDADRPRVLVSQSATGYYGPRGDEPIDESAPAGSDFLADVVAQWEAEASSAEDLCRVVRTRTGVVLAPKGGALDKMLPFFRLGIGGPVGTGRQYLPWIHLDDVVAALIRAVDDERLSGAVNLTAPTPATNRELSKALGRALHRPAALPVPSLALKALYGGMSAIVLTGQRALPARLEAIDFSFRYRELEAALSAVVRELKGSG